MRLDAQENQFSRTLSGLPLGETDAYGCKRWETYASSDGVWGNWFARAREGLGYVAPRAG